MPKTTLVAHGIPDPGSANAVAERPGTIVCMATTGHTGAGAHRRHTGLAHTVLGSVALRVVRHATVPVLVDERR